jgi:lysophospholipase L1-like esterase
MRKSWILPLFTLVAATLGVTTAGEAPASAAPTTPLRVMPLGDSITWGVGSSTGNGYRAPLWNRLAADGHPLDFVGTGRAGSMSDPDNEGHSGYRIDQIAALADASLTRYRPNVVTLHIGTNDLNGSYQPSTAADRLRSLVNQVTAAAPDATVLVAPWSCPPAGRRSSTAPRTTRPPAKSSATRRPRASASHSST